MSKIEYYAVQKRLLVEIELLKLWNVLVGVGERMLMLFKRRDAILLKGSSGTLLVLLLPKEARLQREVIYEPRSNFQDSSLHSAFVKQIFFFQDFTP